MYIPDSIIYIDSGSFEDCTALNIINYSGTVDDWDLITIDTDWAYNSGNFIIKCSNGNLSKNNY